MPGDDLIERMHQLVLDAVPGDMVNVLRDDLEELLLRLERAALMLLGHDGWHEREANG